MYTVIEAHGCVSKPNEPPTQTFGGVVSANRFFWTVHFKEPVKNDSAAFYVSSNHISVCRAQNARVNSHIVTYVNLLLFMFIIIL